MTSHSLRSAALGLIPVALIACTEIKSSTGSPISTAPLVGVDLGSSGRVAQIAGLAGEGEGYGISEPGNSRTEHGAIPGATGGSAGNGAMPGMNHGAMAAIDHRAMSGTPMNHASMGNVSQGSTPGMRMDRGAMPGASHPPQTKIASAGDSMAGMDHSTGQKLQMAHSGHGHAQGSGTVNSVDAAAHKVNLSHGPISAIGWPAMTMDFAVASSVDLGALKPGMRVNFMMEQGQDGMYVIQSITPAGGGQR